MHASTARVNFSDTVTSVPAPKTPPASLVNSVAAPNIIKPQQRNSKWNTFIMAAATIMVTACLIYVIMRIIKISRNITSVEYFMDKDKECASPEIGDPLCDAQTCHRPTPAGACHRPTPTYTESTRSTPPVRAHVITSYGRAQMTSLRDHAVFDPENSTPNEVSKTFVPNILQEVHLMRRGSAAGERGIDLVGRASPIDLVGRASSIESIGRASSIESVDRTSSIESVDHTSSIESVDRTSSSVGTVPVVHTTQGVVDVSMHETINAGGAITGGGSTTIVPDNIGVALRENVGDLDISMVKTIEKSSEEPPRIAESARVQTTMDMSEISESLMQSLEIFDTIHIQNPAEMILLGDVLILNEIFGTRLRTTSMEIEEIEEEKDMKEQDEKDEKVQVRPRGGAAGHADAGHADAGHADAGRADAGRADAGRADAGHADDGTADAGRADDGTADAGTRETCQEKSIEDMVLNGMQPLTCLLKKMDDAMHNENNTEDTSSQSSADSPRPVRKTLRTNPVRANTRKAVPVAVPVETVDTVPVRRRGRPAKAQPANNPLVLS